MKKFYSFFIIGLFFSFTSCDGLLETDNADTQEPKTTASLYVKFINEEKSTETITAIELQPMGVAGTMDGEPLGDYGENILTDGLTLAPGEHTFFNLEIPNSHYSRYRLGIADEFNNTFMLHLQENYSNEYDGTITHWGGDDRTVTVTVVKDEMTGRIYVSGWGDWAGID